MLLFAGCAFKQLAFVVGGGRLVLGRSSVVGASLEGLNLIRQRRYWLWFNLIDWLIKLFWCLNGRRTALVTVVSQSNVVQ